jgi:hypothetical protein
VLLPGPQLLGPVSPAHPCTCSSHRSLSEGPDPSAKGPDRLCSPGTQSLGQGCRTMTPTASLPAEVRLMLPTPLGTRPRLGFFLELQPARTSFMSLSLFPLPPVSPGANPS